MKRTAVILAIAALACHKAEKPAATTTVTTTTMKAAQPAPEPPSPPTNAGDAMPAYQAKTIDGAPFDIAAQKGSVVLLNVWATWCNPCRFEIPELEKMYEANARRGFKIIGVSVDEGDAAEVKKFVAEQKMTYPIVLDPDGRIANVLSTTVLPTTVLLNRQGKIVWREIGAIPADDPTLKKALDAALAGS
jgi:cytochrome c biogenesis protein CcmG, thiol:disulfide interchange protein DsbE